jgi:hypothetical protein
VTPHLQLCGQESAPQHRSHIPYLRPVQRPPSTQFAARQMVASRRRFFIHTTTGLVVMAFKLLFESKRLCANASQPHSEEVAGLSMCLTHT